MSNLKKTVPVPEGFSSGWPHLAKGTEYYYFEVMTAGGRIFHAYPGEESVRLWQSSTGPRIKALLNQEEFKEWSLDHLHWYSHKTKQPLKSEIIYWKMIEPTKLIFGVAS